LKIRLLGRCDDSQLVPAAGARMNRAVKNAAPIPSDQPICLSLSCSSSSRAWLPEMARALTPMARLSASTPMPRKNGSLNSLTRLARGRRPWRSR
jgi:hypothetical protein